MVSFDGRRVHSFGALCVLGVCFVLFEVTFSDRGLTTLMAAARAQTARANKPVQWERVVRDAYENKGVARIERLGERWILSVWCRGTHSTYLDSTTEDLNRYSDLFLRVQYSYVEREVTDPKCLRAPCSPLRQRLISIKQLTPLKITLEEARKRDRECE